MSRSDIIHTLLDELEEVTIFLRRNAGGNDKTTAHIERSQAVIDRHRINYPKKEKSEKAN